MMWPRIEPVLQPLQGEKFRHKSAIMDEDARLDFVARGFWQGRNERSTYVSLTLMLQLTRNHLSLVFTNVMRT